MFGRFGVRGFRARVPDDLLRERRACPGTRRAARRGLGLPTGAGPSRVCAARRGPPRDDDCVCPQAEQAEKLLAGYYSCDEAHGRAGGNSRRDLHDRPGGRGRGEDHEGIARPAIQASALAGTARPGPRKVAGQDDPLSLADRKQQATETTRAPRMSRARRACSRRSPSVEGRPRGRAAAEATLRPDPRRSRWRQQTPGARSPPARPA